MALMRLKITDRWIFKTYSDYQLAEGFKNDFAHRILLYRHEKYRYMGMEEVLRSLDQILSVPQYIKAIGGWKKVLFEGIKYYPEYRARVFL